MKNLAVIAAALSVVACARTEQVARVSVAKADELCLGHKGSMWVSDIVNVDISDRPRAERGYVETTCVDGTRVMYNGPLAPASPAQ